MSFGVPRVKSTGQGCRKRKAFGKHTIYIANSLPYHGLLSSLTSRLILLREAVCPAPGGESDCFKSVRVISTRISRVPSSQGGHVAQFWLEEKPAGKVSGNNFVCCWKSPACRGRCALSAVPYLLFLGSWAENVIPSTEAAILHLWSSKLEDKKARWERQSRENKAQFLDEIVEPLHEVWNIIRRLIAVKHIALLNLPSSFCLTHPGW